MYAFRLNQYIFIRLTALLSPIKSLLIFQWKLIQLLKLNLFYLIQPLKLSYIYNNYNFMVN